MSTDRINLIEQVITDHLVLAGTFGDSTGNIVITTWEPEAWVEDVPAIPEHRQGKLLGFLPATFTPDGKVEIQFCPAVIAQVTAHLDDTQLEAFLTMVKLANSTSIANIDVPGFDRAQIVDDALARHQAHYRLYVEVQMRALATT